MRMKRPHFGMLPEQAFKPRTGRMAFGGGGMTFHGCCGPAPSPAPAAPTQTTVQNTNIPCYAKPYVQTMLGATTQQLFNTTGSGCCIQITGVKPYVPYSTNPQDYVAGFSPLQQKAQQGAANLTTPGQFGAATGSATTGSNQAMGAGQGLQNTLTSAQGIGQYMNPYIQNVLNPALALSNQQYGMNLAQEQGQATNAGAFGGSREALMAGLNQQNQMLANNQLIGNAYNTAYNNAQGAATNVAGMNLQGGQAGIAGGQALGQLGTQCLAAQMNVLNTQSQAGAQQQQNQQQVINNAINNYAVAQQYPQQQLAFMNAQLRGLPLQSSTVQQYNAPPSGVSQAAGLGTAGIAGLGLYNAMSGNTSDIRAKENIEAVGWLPNGLPVYEFEYKAEFKDKAGHGRYRGVMAHDVEEIMPQAVNVDSNGYKLVSYPMLGIKMEQV